MKSAKSVTTRVYTYDELEKMVMDWIHEQRRDRTFSDDMGSIDFTYNSHRTRNKKAFGVMGGSSGVIPTKVSKYTDGICACFWNTDDICTPCMLFTYDPKFRDIDTPGTPPNKDAEHLWDCLEKYEITRDRVIYLQPDGKGSQLYAKENSEMVRYFFNLYEDEIENTIFSDQGSAFKDGSHSLIESLGAIKHVVYPAPVHMFLSPNDNSIFGQAKKAWRRARNHDFKDNVDASLHLMHLIDMQSEKSSVALFNRNMLLDQRDVTKQGVAKMLKNGRV